MHTIIRSGNYKFKFVHPPIKCSYSFLPFELYFFLSSSLMVKNSNFKVKKLDIRDSNIDPYICQTLFLKVTWIFKTLFQVALFIFIFILKKVTEHFDLLYVAHLSYFLN
jgi:hypothetical protein